MSKNKIWALGGESHTAPENTIPAFWAAIGAGASGIAVEVSITSDNTVVCTGNINAPETEKLISELSADEVRALDAGLHFQSTVLDNQNSPTVKGSDNPWSGEGKSDFQRLYYPALTEFLKLFSRRTGLMFILKSIDDRTSELVVEFSKILKKFGVDRSSVIVGDKQTFPLINQSLPEAESVLIATNLNDDINAAGEFNASTLLLQKGGSLQEDLAALEAVGLNSYVVTKPSEFALSPSDLDLVSSSKSVSGVVCRAIHETLEFSNPNCVVFEDRFAGNKTDSSSWDVGYSKNNNDTDISQNNALIIDIKHGGEYSGAAAVTNFCIHDAFDATVKYHVSNPHQGTTFELAVIQVDPGYRKVNLTFDVHGAPPYASSERDEDDGFRIGWNNGPALTKFAPTSIKARKDEDDDFKVDYVRDEAQSSNLYNEYSRDVGYAKSDSLSGELRLVRNGAVFNAYYKDKFNKAWVLSGTALVGALADDVFFRLGAKHWPKKGITPPENTVTFNDFTVYQRKI